MAKTKPTTFTRYEKRVERTALMCVRACALRHMCMPYAACGMHACRPAALMAG